MADDIFAEKLMSSSQLNSIFKENLNVQYESLFYPNYDTAILNKSEYFYSSGVFSNSVSTGVRSSEYNLIRNSTETSASYYGNFSPDNYQIYEDFNTTENPNLMKIFTNNLTFPGLALIIIFSALIITTVIGNTLVILSVVTTRRLRTVTNCFVMSLAIADLLVGCFVMPPAVAVHIIGNWTLGWVLCDIWISLDVLLCTASILSLCAISIDRYLAVTRPLTYSRKRRSKRLALIMILVVWVLALAITCPPILGWYEPGRRNDVLECRYNQNEGYVVFSAMGSFFIPMAVMIYVYGRISCVVASRHENMTSIEVQNKKCKRYHRADVEFELEHDPDISEQDNSSPKNRRGPSQSLSNQAFAKEIKETSFGNNTSDQNKQCRNGNYEAISLNRSSSFKGPSPLLLSAKNSNSSSNADNWSYGHRYSVRHHGATNISSEYNVNKNTTRVHQKSIANRVTSLKRENKTTQTLSIVVGGFIACWLPFFIYYLVTPFISEESVDPMVAKILTWLGWFNSAINPFIYAFYSVDFRAAFWRLTFKRFFKNPPKGQFPSNTMSIRR